MKRLFFAVYCCLFSLLAAASGGEGLPLDHVKVDLSDKSSLQSGAKLFVNYCLSCHAAGYMRYNRMGRDLGLSEEQVEQNLMFATDKIGDLMSVAVRPAEAGKWFGIKPPDLTVIARSRGPDWLYTYLRGFYLDDSRPYGVNNVIFKGVGMPHVLWELQGWQKPVYRTVTDAHGKTHQEIERLELVSPGTLSAAEYDAAVRDLVNFMSYMGEPMRLERQHLGIKVILFLAVFTLIAYFLKKEYWRDVH